MDGILTLKEEQETVHEAVPGNTTLLNLKTHVIKFLCHTETSELNNHWRDLCSIWRNIHVFLWTCFKGEGIPVEFLAMYR